MPAVDIEIPPRAPYVAVVRLAVAALARAAGVDEERVEDLKIAVSEACANAVIAHEELGSDEPVAVRWSDTDDSISVEVADRGPSLEVSGSDVHDSQGFSTRVVMSRALLESLVDVCRISGRDGGGTSTHLELSR